MASVGHFITLMGVIFFFFMLCDTHFEKKTATLPTLGLPRWYKRTMYYLYKICYLVRQLSLLSRMPSRNYRSTIVTLHDNEYEENEVKVHFG